MKSKLNIWRVLGILLITPALITVCGGEQAAAQQSPVNIVGYTTGDTSDLSFEYSGNAKYLTNTGEFVKVNYDNSGGIRLRDEAYQLVEAHTHNPSEHTIEGERFALEMHLVHKRESGEIAVVGILYPLGEPNLAIQAIIDAAPGEGEPDTPTLVIPASDFLPVSHGYYAYAGSLTTPPYTEGVRWHVMSEVLEVSEEQVEQLAALTGGGTNSRELQPLNGREITAY